MASTPHLTRNQLGRFEERLQRERARLLGLTSTSDTPAEMPGLADPSDAADVAEVQVERTTQNTLTEGRAGAARAGESRPGQADRGVLRPERRDRRAHPARPPGSPALGDHQRRGRTPPGLTHRRSSPAHRPTRRRSRASWTSSRRASRVVREGTHHELVVPSTSHDECGASPSGPSMRTRDVARTKRLQPHRTRAMGHSRARQNTCPSTARPSPVSPRARSP